MTIKITHHFKAIENNKNTYFWTDFSAFPFTSGPTIWMMRSFLDMGALGASSWVASVSVTTGLLSSSSRGLLDMVEVPGVAETGVK